LAFQPETIIKLPTVTIEKVKSAYYLRLSVADQPGVLADITRILADSSISIEAIIQKEPPPGETQLPVIMLTHCVIEEELNRAIHQIENLKTVGGSVKRIRVEPLG
jgi:homoserine dehydrogenase